MKISFTRPKYGLKSSFRASRLSPSMKTLPVASKLMDSSGHGTSVPALGVCNKLTASSLQYKRSNAADPRVCALLRGCHHWRQRIPRVDNFGIDGTIRFWGLHRGTDLESSANLSWSVPTESFVVHWISDQWIRQRTLWGTVRAGLRHGDDLQADIKLGLDRDPQSRCSQTVGRDELFKPDRHKERVSGWHACELACADAEN